MSEVQNLSKVDLSFHFTENRENNISVFFPFNTIFNVVEDGNLDFRISPLSSGKLPIPEFSNYVYLFPSIPLKLNVLNYGNVFELKAMASRPILLNSIISGIEYTNDSSSGGVIKLVFFKVDKNSNFSVTWGSRIIQMGNTFFNLGDQ